MSDYIEREAAKLRIFEYGVKHRDNANIASACENLERQINYIPAADVRPVVLCRDCKNYIERSGACAYLVVGIREDDFCSYGRKREES